MTKKYLTPIQQKDLKQNPYVKEVSDKAITYTDELKRLFIAQSETGKLPREIFEEAGLDVSVIGITRVRKAANRWRSAYKKHGISVLEDTRKHGSGRLRERELSIEEKYARLEVKMRLLEAENELLKKIDLLERQLLKKK